MELIAFLFVVMVYFAPWVTAVQRKHPQSAAILIVNLLLGWTLIGWAGCCAWAYWNFDEGPRGR